MYLNWESTTEILLSTLSKIDVILLMLQYGRYIDIWIGIETFLRLKSSMEIIISTSNLLKSVCITVCSTYIVGLRVTFKHSSIFLAPKCHCDSVEYIFNDNLAEKTVSAHKWINGFDEPDLGCPDSGKVGQKYEKGIRYVIW